MTGSDADPIPHLKQSPLFSGLSEEDLRLFLSVFEPVKLTAGQELFPAGAVPTTFHILVEGELSIRDGEEERSLVRPVAPIGELGAVTGWPRVLTAVAASSCTVLAASMERLHGLLGEHGRIAVNFHRGLLILATRKIARDQRRLREMRGNIITTQKAMKRMRQALLDSEDTPLHASLFEELDAQIEQNRKGHYLVEPSRLLTTEVVFDDGARARVLAVSNEWLHYERTPGSGAAAPEPGNDWSAVLRVGDHELPVSGTVDAVDEREVVIYMDELIEPSAHILDEHLSRLQMLDVVL